MTNELELKHRHEAFVQAYCVDFNGAKAAREAGYAEDCAAVVACNLLKRPAVQARIDERKKELAVAAELSPQWVLKRWMEIACADPNELTQSRRVNCRHCWGVDHNYQWTVAEFQRAVTKALRDKQPAPDGMGGFDFEPQNDPCPDCQECGGEGVVYIHIADTRKTKSKIFAGVKQTKNGIEVLTRDQDAALQNLAKYLGMSKEHIDIKHVEAKSLDDFYATKTPK